MNELKHSAEFRSVLTGYNLSPAALDILKQTHLVLLDGPTSSGRNTIINGLVETGDFYHIVSDTTRHIREKNGRPIEKNGREYWFRSEADVLDGLRRGQYMEAAVIHNQQVSGCSISELSKALAAKKIAVKDIEPAGARTIHDLKPDATIIFVLPPSFEVWMQRLLGRGGIPVEELRRRLESARAELTAALANDYYTFVINDKIDDTITAVHVIAKFGQLSPLAQRHGRQLAEKLKKVTEKHLLTKRS
jgi:guanylate kinase